jgi:hypothetical protein
MVVDLIDRKLREAHLHIMILIKAITENKYTWDCNWDFADDLAIIYVDDSRVDWNILIDLLVLKDGNVQYLMTLQKGNSIYPLKINKISSGKFREDFKELYEHTL